MSAEILGRMKSSFPTGLIGAIMGHAEALENHVVRRAGPDCVLHQLQMQPLHRHQWRRIACLSHTITTHPLLLVPPPLTIMDVALLMAGQQRTRLLPATVARIRGQALRAVPGV
jgi:hypothetical protein